jgi:hypothetical protein
VRQFEFCFQPIPDIIVVKIGAMKKRLAATALIAALLGWEPTYACRANWPAEHRIRTLGSTIVVLAEVEQVAYFGARSADWHQWRGVAIAKRMLAGETSIQRFDIGRSGSTAACDDGIGPPRPGALWVLYLGEQDGKSAVMQAYPLPIARDADPNLSTISLNFDVH